MTSLKNRVQLIGHLGADPEVKTIENGVKMARLRLATNESYKTPQGEWKEETQWHTVSVWEKVAERAELQLHKGSYLMLEGKLITRSFTDATGNKKYYTEVRATNLIVLDKKQAEQSMVLPEMTDEEAGQGLPF
jgi:single-strand DNA-binding protein